MKVSKSLQFRQCANVLHQQAAPALPKCETEPKPLNVPSLEQVSKTRKTKLNPALTTHFKTPAYITQGSMQWLWDHSGKRYLDLFGGIVTVSVGHCHPKVNKALKDQVDTLWHTTNIYLHPKIHEYAERLVATLPEPLTNVYFVNSGSEANDMAMYMARLYTGNFDLLSFRNSYHGMSPYTMGLTAHTPWSYKVPTNFGIHHVMNPDPYKGIFGGKNCRDSPVDIDRSCDCPQGQCLASEQYLGQLDDVLVHSIPKGKSLAGFFAESIQGVGGTVQYPKGYLKKAFQKVRDLGGVCVSDEVQTGFGRTGEHFWGFQGHDVVPDIVTMAKGIGNGFPMAALVTTKEIADVMSQAIHFNTFGGNPMASAVGIAVLDALEEDKCQENSAKVGTYFLKQLGDLRSQYKTIGDVRGKGLMIGIEMVEDKANRKPLAAEKMMSVWEDVKNMGVLLGKGGLNGNVFRIKPPMCITKEDVDVAIEIFKIALDKHGMK